MAMSSLEKMKQRLKKSSPKISGRANLENINQIRNFVFGKKKAMGIDDDVKGIATQKAKKKIADNKKKKTTTTTKKTFGKSPGALGGKVTAKKDKVNIGAGLSEALRKQKNKKTTTTIKKKKPTADGEVNVTIKKKKPTIVTKEQLAKSGLSLRDYMNFLQGKTRRDDKKTATKKKTSAKIMVDDFKKSNVKANKNKKAGIDAAKGDNKKVKTLKKKTKSKLDSKGNYKGTNIKPTKLQLERLKKRGLA